MNTTDIPSPDRPGAHGAVGAALAAPTFGPKMGVCNYLGVSDIVLICINVCTLVSLCRDPHIALIQERNSVKVQNSHVIL